jgi:superfamily II DNA or RNA helicase
MDWPKVDFENSPPGSALWQQRTLQQRILKNKATFREDRRQEFIDAIKPYSTRLTKLDVGITQAKVHKVLVGMSVDQERVYRQLTKDSFAYLPARSKRRAKKRVTAPLAITLIAKQRQVATGFVYDDEGNLHDLGENKLSKLLELVTVLSKPLVVFTAFRPDNDLVYEALVNRGYDVVQVNGSTKKKLRPQIWRDFQRAQFDVAVVQTKTGGTGVDLWKARNAVVYSMTHSYRDWDQSLSRLDSKHNKSPSEFFVLCTKNTVDEHLFDLVIVKKLTTEEILKHLKRGPQPWHVRQPQKSLKPKSLKPRRARKLNPSME